MDTKEASPTHRMVPSNGVMVPSNGVTMKGAVQPVKKLAGIVIIRIVRNTENISRRSG